MHSRLTLYRARITALRADRGSVTWHEAIATIREHHGNTVAALGHQLAAGIKHLRKQITAFMRPAAEALGELADAVAELERAFENRETYKDFEGGGDDA